MPTRLDLDFETITRRPAPRRRVDGAPMRILLLGDFSGRAARGLHDPAGLAGRAPLRVDLDNLDSVVARLAPVVEHASEGAIVAIPFASLDDFHPDRVFEGSELFAPPRDLRARLSDPARVAQAKAELLGGDTEPDAATMKRLLGREGPAAAPAVAPVAGSAEAAVDALVRRLVVSDSVPAAGPEQAQLVAAADLTIAERMRALLHDPHFQALEAAWRTVQLLVSRLELDEDLQLHLFDVTRPELAAAAAEPELERTGLWKALVDRPLAIGDSGWSMVIALESFDASHGDVSLLATLAATAAATGAPLVGTASPRLLGCETVSPTTDPDDWQPLDADSQARCQALRRSPLAPWIGLVAPRLLLRLPYGKATDPLERFELDEMAGADPAQALLWGHPGAACALLAGLAFRNSGWQMDLDAWLDVEDLPAWVCGDGDERQLYPCAEAWLGERGAEAVMVRGPMALISRRDRPAVRLMRWQSIADPAAALSGPWVG
jgi:type VI secretion system ImpC/EvpB family protein